MYYTSIKCVCSQSKLISVIDLIMVIAIVVLIYYTRGAFSNKSKIIGGSERLWQKFADENLIKSTNSMVNC